MTKMDPKVQFDFGENWEAFSEASLNEKALAQSKHQFIELISSDDLRGKSFVDIGFGQGLGLLNATSLGAKTVGCDINPLCATVLARNQEKFPELKDVKIPVVVGSILHQEKVDSIANNAPEKDVSKYDIVHSWGVLHHTGSMWQAIENSMQLVKDGGTFIIAIYNKHWSSSPWWLIKRIYNFLPKWGRYLMVKLFYVVIYLAKFLVTFQNPLKKDRGMNFYYDVIDWLGGYPYEYASKEEIQNYFEERGYALKRFIKAEVPTGCNEFVFEKI